MTQVQFQESKGSKSAKTSKMNFVNRHFDVIQKERGYIISHQVVNLAINLSEESIEGFTELFLFPLTEDICLIKLHCRQCVNDLVAPFDIPIAHYSNENRLNIGQEGEIMVSVPKEIVEIMQTDEQGLIKPFKVRVEYKLKQPQSGIHFVYPDPNREINKSILDPYVFTINHPVGGVTRYWLPCLNRFNDKCTWDLIFTVKDVEGYDELNVVASGNLVKVDHSLDNPYQRTYYYEQDVAVPAQFIGFACGPFTKIRNLLYQDDVALPQDRPEIKAFITDRLSEYLEPTMLPSESPNISKYWVSDIINWFIEKFPSSVPNDDTYHSSSFYPSIKDLRFPFKSLNIVFVEGAYHGISITAGLIICNSQLLHNYRIIEQRFETMQFIAHGIAQQWFGIFLSPYKWRDLWLGLGLSYYWVEMYYETVFSEDKIRLDRKKRIESVTQKDVNQYAICSDKWNFPLSVGSFDFIQTKASLVIWMLDKRLSLLGYSRRMPGLIYLILGDAKSSLEMNKLQGFLNTRDFLLLCKFVIRRELHDEINAFSRQWIYGSGCPIFKVACKFSRKNLIVEFDIEQKNTNSIALNSSNTLNSAYFTGKLEVSVKEPDGYEYINTLDIHKPHQIETIHYHTKYKRSKVMIKPRMVRKEVTNDEEVAYMRDMMVEYNMEEELPEFFGLDPENNVDNEWMIHEWADDPAARNASEQWEYIRVDPEFSWLAKFEFSLPPYMWSNLLEESIDVIDQYKAVQALSKHNSKAAATTLMRTVNDFRYFYDIRIEAVKSLSNFGSDDLDGIGTRHLLKLYESIYCEKNEEDKYIPLPNSFDSWEKYFLQKAMIASISRLRDSNNLAPLEIKKFLYQRLKWNDNSKNYYSDDYLINILVRSLANSFAKINNIEKNSKSNKDTSTSGEVFYLSLEDQEYKSEIINIIEEIMRRDRSLGSYKDVVLESILWAKSSLMMNQVIDKNKHEFIYYAKVGNHYSVRKMSLRALWILGYNRDDFEVKNLLKSLSTSDPDLGIRNYVNTLYGVDQGLIRLEYPKKDMTGSTRLKLKFSKSSKPAKTLTTPMECEEDIRVEDSEDSLSNSNATEESHRHLRTKPHKHKKSRSSKTKKEGKQPSIEPEAIKQLIATIEESLIETEVAESSKKRKKKNEKVIDNPIHISSSRKRKSVPAVEEISEIEKRSKKSKRPKK
ncbi:10466_t:CDS:10 [Funneliformis mosseae]|uniref:Transcription initiation factor TFIID subunit 2 n=1 Tax=Funneliformis mosseae TaxID=27381 RepID=A0A9N8V6U1_FUNMO|nr:10466_t:CDS:10 [Funneliformis mosseae]